ncbi:Gmad2 immunoglobulin-like domain-containing protein [Corynebacterium guangdongense]|uniref:Nucleoid-associated protein YgaU n=1 Tax=Corynebacterium guangdongense TaxID=1783348 RepID=A0ABU2A0E8_9CORY|nr:Gmad2 immunoglobulin-like domain-containing protein [Corynebacterium guangdongense]MDR7330667.1 nucleoid-associated protein YgaU [Corynebacterium guangdongense]WJZ16683.1 LysM domain/BON superfamily protein [Corynebacterium guangdongense]
MTIKVQQPQPYDIVSNTVQIAGTAGGAFEASYNYRISEGHDEVEGYFMAGDGAGGHGQFQTVADVSGAAFTHVVAYVEVFHTSPKDGSPRDRVVVPVILGARIVPGYTSYFEHVVKSGETLWGIAQQHYGTGNLYHRLLAANPSITNPNLIHAGDVIRVPRA